jgi:acetyl-CoA synthetase
MPDKKTGSVESSLIENRVFHPSPDFVDKALVSSIEKRNEMWRNSIENPDQFWAEMAEHIDWFKKWDKVEEYDFGDNFYIRYFDGGQLNASYNCLDRHLKSWRRNKAALIWQGEPLEESKTYTYLQLYHEVCKFANVLKDLGVKKGDRVTVYLPMIPELVITLLACARIGAIHSVVFGGFSSEALRDRILDAGAETLITCNYGYRSGKVLQVKETADEALLDCPKVKNCVVVRRIDRDCEMKGERDYWYHDLMKNAHGSCEPEHMDAEDPLFILYTSGSTGKPKGVLHTTGGYLVYTNTTFRYIFDYRDEDLFLHGRYRMGYRAQLHSLRPSLGRGNFINI